MPSDQYSAGQNMTKPISVLSQERGVNYKQCSGEKHLVARACRQWMLPKTSAQLEIEKAKIMTVLSKLDNIFLVEKDQKTQLCRSLLCELIVTTVKFQTLSVGW